MHQLVANDELAEGFGEVEEFGGEGEAVGGGDGGPFGAHRAEMDLTHANSYPGSPVAHGPAQIVGVVPFG